MCSEVIDIFLLNRHDNPRFDQPGGPLSHAIPLGFSLGVLPYCLNPQTKIRPLNQSNQESP